MTTSLSPTEALVIGVPAILLGLVLLLFGYRFFRVLVVIVGALVGALVSARLGPMLMVAGAVVGAAFAFAFYRFGVALVGALAGFLLLAGFQGAPALFGLPEWALPLAAAVVGGVIALLLERPAITVATAFDGAFLTWFGSTALLPIPDTGLDVAIVLAIAALGVIVQRRWTAGDKNI